MAWRYRRSVKILPGVKINFGKHGVSTTLGVRGASVNFSRRGTYLNTGLPGTGISNRQRISGPRSSRSRATSGRSPQEIEAEIQQTEAEIQRLQSSLPSGAAMANATPAKGPYRPGLGFVWLIGLFICGILNSHLLFGLWMGVGVVFWLIVMVKKGRKQNAEILAQNQPASTQTADGAEATPDANADAESASVPPFSKN